MGERQLFIQRELFELIHSETILDTKKIETFGVPRFTFTKNVHGHFH